MQKGGEVDEFSLYERQFKDDVKKDEQQIKEELKKER